MLLTQWEELSKMKLLKGMQQKFTEANISIDLNVSSIDSRKLAMNG